MGIYIEMCIQSDIVSNTLFMILYFFLYVCLEKLFICVCVCVCYTDGMMACHDDDKKRMVCDLLLENGL